MKDDAVTERLEQEDPSVDWSSRRSNLVRRMLEFFERITLALEHPIDRIVRLRHLNPLYHTGPVTTFLLLIILVTGVYLTMFYRYGFDPSYQSVAALESSVIGRVIRALHRYASGAALVTALLHGWRTFFQDRFRAARWPAWVTGVVMTAFIWIIGLTGYWMIWDERVGPLNDVLIKLLQGSPAGERFVFTTLVPAEGNTGWLFMLILFLVHLLLSAVIGLFLWWHIKRLRRTKWMPPKYWMWLLGGLLTVASIAVPVRMLPKLSETSLPARFPLDVFYLFPLLTRSPWTWVLIGAAVTTVVSLIPWILRRRPLDPIVIDRDRCTGCTFCVEDCPYGALRMIPREDGKHQQEAVVDPDLCVSCGICIGSCPEKAMTLGDRPIEGLWNATLDRIAAHGDHPTVVFQCERHALQGGRDIDDSSIVVPLTCIGMAPPSLAGDAIEAGAGEVRFVGCPPEDCANREGNEWLEERIDRKRRPRLRRIFANAPIGSFWLPPDETKDALRSPLGRERATGYGLSPSSRDLVRPGTFMAVVLVIQLLLTNLSFTPHNADAARVTLEMLHVPGRPIIEVPETGTELLPGEPITIDLAVDGTTIVHRTYGQASKTAIFEQFDLEPGLHTILLTMVDSASGPVTLYNETATLQPGQILTLAFHDLAVGGDPEAGKALFERTAVVAGAGCVICHSREPGKVIVGPSLADVGSRAGTRIPGMTAEEYLTQSIVDPDAYVVDGFPAGQMLPDFGERLTEQQIDDLVAYLLTLKGDQ